MSDLNLHCRAAYAGYLEEDAALLSCTSGGIATALSQEMVRRGGYVAGVVYADDYKSAQYHITNRAEDLDRFKGSKYVEVHKGTVYADVKALLEAGEAVLFFGLPCTVAALRAYLKKEYDKLMTVDLICHGPTDARVHRQYIEHLEQTYQSRVVDFSVRRKKDTWLPAYLHAVMENGKEFMKPFYHTEYGYAFSVMAKKACYTCAFRGDKRTGDLMLGDFHGVREEDEFWNPKGVSAILVGSEKGQDMLLHTPGIRLFETTCARIAENNPNVIRPRDSAPQRKKFEELLDSHDLFYAAEHSKAWTTRVKRWVKRLLGK